MNKFMEIISKIFKRKKHISDFRLRILKNNKDIEATKKEIKHLMFCNGCFEKLCLDQN